MQLQRIEFAMKRALNDQAYYKTLEKLAKRQPQQGSREGGGSSGRNDHTGGGGGGTMMNGGFSPN